MSNGNGNGHGSGGGRRNGGPEISWTALVLAGFVAFAFAGAKGEAPVPDLRNGTVDPVYENNGILDSEFDNGGGEPAPAPEAACTTEEALAVITASGLTVVEWQRQAGIVDDGIVGPQTRAAACG